MEANRPFGEDRDDSDVAGLDVVEALDAVESTVVDRDAAEARMFTLAAHFADLFAPESLKDKAGRSGAERAVLLGGEGTPKLAEFAPAAFAGRAGISTFAGQKMIADALDCRHRLPRLWSRVQAGQVRVGYARLVARKTRHLSVEQAGFVDEQVATYADGRLAFVELCLLAVPALLRLGAEGKEA
ncbi:MAG TPA: hypothetical protein VFJ19_04655 [Nocardioidaceae bacterium]|nr:hypothetical protein [Nocardioidaceae bacterium]